MNEPENKIQDSSDLTALRQEYADLRKQSGFLLISLVVLSATFATYVGIQSRRAGMDLALVRKQAMQVEEATKKESPGVQHFLNQLLQFGQRNPDFMPILNKYQIRRDTNAPVQGAAPVQP